MNKVTTTESGQRRRAVAMFGWIGVDLDATLAHYDRWTGGAIGEPIPTMVARVKK